MYRSSHDSSGAKAAIAEISSLHAELLIPYRELRRVLKGRPSREEKLYGRINELLDRISAAGKIVGSFEERRQLQSIADYWSAELWRFAAHERSEHRPLALAPFSGPPTVAPQDDKVRIEESQRDSAAQEKALTLVRLAAASRLWSQFGKDAGFLILGRKAIDVTGKLNIRDNQIKQFVQASNRYHRRWKLLITFVGVPLSLIIVFLLLLYFWIIPHAQDNAYNAALPYNENINAKIRGGALAKLSCLNSIRRPSSEKLFTGVDLTNTPVDKFQMTGASFVQMRACNTNINNSSFNYSVFSEAKISHSEFRRTDFRYSQFQKTEINSSVMSDVDLTRAIFDNSNFKQVKFDGSILFQTSFLGATFDESTLRSISQNGWWLGAGWSSDVLENMAHILTKRSYANDTATSEAFKYSYKKNFIESICKSLPWPAPGTELENTSAPASLTGLYNALASFYARWGVGLGRPSLDEEELKTCHGPPNLDALDLARSALQDAKSGQSNDAIARSSATLGYVLLQYAQKNESRDVKQSVSYIEEALSLLDSAVNMDKSIDETGILRALAHYKYTLLNQVSMEKKSQDISHALQKVTDAVAHPRFTSFDPLYHLSRGLGDANLVEAIVEGLRRREPLPQTASSSGQQTVPGVQDPAMAVPNAESCKSSKITPTSADDPSILDNITDLLCFQSSE